MCVVFFHTYTRAKTHLLLFSTKPFSFRLLCRCVGSQTLCVHGWMDMVPHGLSESVFVLCCVVCHCRCCCCCWLMPASMYVYTNTVTVCRSLPLPNESVSRNRLCYYHCMCVFFRAIFWIPIGIVKYLEGGVFIHTDFAVVVKNNDAKINTRKCKALCIVSWSVCVFRWRWNGVWIYFIYGGFVLYAPRIEHISTMEQHLAIFPCGAHR